jgi:hypothetical protein
MSYFSSKEAAVQFVSDTLQSSKTGSPLTMIIGRDKSGDFYAHTAIDIQSEDTAEKPYRLSMTISPEITPDG